MMRALLATLLFLSTADARAEDGVWGFMVFDHEGNFVTAKWPEEHSIIAGSSEDAFLRLDGLAPLHAYFELQDAKFLVRPMFEATVLVNGARIEGETLIDTRDTVTLGTYRINFSLATDPPPEDLPPAAYPEADIQAADKAETARKAEFGKKAYAFCHDDQFGRDGTPGTDFCAIFDDTTKDVCPKAKETCPQWKEYEGSYGSGAGGGAGGVGKGNGKKGSGKAGEGKGNTRRIVKRRVVLPIPKEIGIGLLLLVGGALLFWFVKSMLSAGWEGEELDLEVDELSDAAKNLQALPEARSNVLVKLAERALGRGDAEEASILLHLAVLRHLDDEGLARYHPSKTNGDYLRAIRKLPELRALFRGIANETERVRFGDGHVDGAAVGRLIEGAKSALKRAPDTVEGIPGTAILILLALMPALQACPSGEEDEAMLPAYYSHGPTGLSALPTILRESGLDVSLGHERFADVEPGVGVVVFRTSAASKTGWPKDMRLDELLDRNLQVVVIDDRARSSFFLPTTELMDWGAPTSVSLAVTKPNPESFCSWRISALRERFEDGAPALPRGRRIAWDGFSSSATVSQHRLRLHPVIEYAGESQSGDKIAAVAYVADRVDGEATLSGCMYVFSDRDLFTNASLTRASNARFVSSFFASITPAGQRIAILDRLDAWSTASGAGGGDGSGDSADNPSPAQTLQASNMLPFVLQALVTMVLLFVLLGAAFGPLRDPIALQHKAFVEHVEAIGRQYARTGQAGLNHAAQSLAKLVVMRHRDRVRGGSSGGWLALAKHLAETHSLPEEDVKAALRLGIEGVTELGTPRLDDPPPSSQRILLTLSRLLSARSKDVVEKPKRGRFRFRDRKA